MPVTSDLVIWSIDLSAHGSELAALALALDLFPSDERERLATITDLASRSERAASQAALRLALVANIGPEIARTSFTRSPAGKPGLAGDAAHFSLAHTDGAALVAISKLGPVGIDIEGRRDVAVGPDRHAAYTNAAITLGQGAALPGSNEHDRFIAAWTRVEAMAKATGLGIAGLIAAIDLRAAATSPLSEQRLTATLGDGAGRLVARDLVLPAPYFGAVAGSSLPAAPAVTPMDASMIATLATRFATPSPPSSVS